MFGRSRLVEGLLVEKLTLRTLLATSSRLHSSLKIVIVDDMDYCEILASSKTVVLYVLAAPV